MEQRVSLITLGVGDLPKSTAFYEALGWRRSVRKAEGIAFFRTGGMALALWPRTHLAKEGGLSPAGSGFAGFALAHNVRARGDVDRVLAEAVACGAKLMAPAAEKLWGGYSGYFADLDGYLWEVAFNPHFPMKADGSIELPD